MPAIAVNVVVIHEGQVLLTQREDLEVWCLPGGGVESGESLAQAAVRETLEETGVEVELTRLVGVYSRQGVFQGDLHAVLFAARPVGGTLRLQPGETIAVRYFHPDELPEDVAVSHLRRIADALRGAAGLAWQQRLDPPMADLPWQEWHARRDRSGLPRIEFYRQCMAGRALVETLDLPPWRGDLPAGGSRLEGGGQAPRPVVYTNVAVICEGRILLIQREDYQVWCMPGGEVEAGESLAQGAIREAREETGLEVRLTGLVGIYSRLGFAGDAHAVLFSGDVSGGTLRPQAGEALDLRFFAPEDIPQALLAGHGQRIRDALNQVRAASWRQEFVPPLFDQVRSRQDIYAIRDQSGLPRVQFYLASLACSRLEEVLEVGE